MRRSHKGNAMTDDPLNTRETVSSVTAPETLDALSDEELEIVVGGVFCLADTDEEGWIYRRAPLPPA